MPVSIGEPASFPKNQNHENKKAKIMFKLTYRYNSEEILCNRAN